MVGYMYKEPLTNTVWQDLPGFNTNVQQTPVYNRSVRLLFNMLVSLGLVTSFTTHC